MFHAFEPASARAGQGPILVTVGGESPPPRQTAARELRQRLGYRVESIPGANHFVQWDDPVAFAAVIRRFVASATALVSDES
jgi:pimeloyl-ACP methyl ester carboxylesterase